MKEANWLLFIDWIVIKGSENVDVSSHAFYLVKLAQEKAELKVSWSFIWQSCQKQFFWFSDFEKAFDTLDLKVLLTKLFRRKVSSCRRV